jgi:hypothetical protein
MILALSMGDEHALSGLCCLRSPGFYFSDSLPPRSSSGSSKKAAMSRLVAREQFAAESATRLLFEIYIGEGLPVQVFHHKTAVQLLDGPGRWEVALRHSP